MTVAGAQMAALTGCDAVRAANSRSFSMNTNVKTVWGLDRQSWYVARTAGCLR